MKLVGDFLSRFKKFTPPDDSLRRAIADAIQNSTKVPVGPKDVTLSRSVAFIKCSSVAKSVIRSARTQILTELFTLFPKARDTVRDIR